MATAVILSPAAASSPSSAAAIASVPAEQYTRFPRPRPRRPMRVEIVMEGWLKKKATKGMIGYKPWQPRYFVLYASSREMRYYGGVAESVAGSLPLDERGSIPLEYITAVNVPEVDTHGGRRFDVHTARFGDHAYPRDVNGVASSGTGVTAAQTKLVTRVFALEAPTIHDRIAWVKHLRSLLGLPGGNAESTSSSFASPSSAALSPAAGPSTRGWPPVPTSSGPGGAHVRITSSFLPDSAAVKPVSGATMQRFASEARAEPEMVVETIQARRARSSAPTDRASDATERDAYGRVVARSRGGTTGPPAEATGAGEGADNDSRMPRSRGSSRAYDMDD